MGAIEATFADLLTNILTAREIELIEGAPLRERAHPVGRLLRPTTSNGYEHYNTLQALRAALAKNPSWLKAQERRLANVEDYTEPASALAEVRAYGYLLATGLDVEPVPRGGAGTVDFLVRCPKDSRIEVEVFAKHMEQSEVDALSAFHQAAPPQLPPGSVAVREHAIAPMGRPRPGESVTENAVSKLAQIKGDERQFSGAEPAILWVDGQDESLSLFPWEKAAVPLVTDRAGFHSGDLWYACYGKPGLPIFERFWPGISGPEGAFDLGHVHMRHNGRFVGQTRLSCIVLAAKHCTLAMENPAAPKRLPTTFWETFSRVRHFDFGLSWVNWPESKLQERLEIEYRRIVELCTTRAT